MEIPDKYLGLINTLIYDKRTKMCGMISELSIIGGFGGYMFAYVAFIDKLHSNTYIFPEDFKKRNIVFLMPYDAIRYPKEMEQLRKKQRKAIQNFFGDEFREDMLMEISEEKRQKEIKEWEKKLCGLENWAKKLMRDEK